MMIKWSKDEKLTDDDIKQLNDLKEKIQKLLRGEMVGQPRKKLNSEFSETNKEN